jgi:hypothetical protein
MFQSKRDEKPIQYAETRIYSDEELHNYTEEELKKFKIKHEVPCAMTWKKALGQALWLTPRGRPAQEKTGPGQAHDRPGRG